MVRPLVSSGADGKDFATHHAHRYALGVPHENLPPENLPHGYLATRGRRWYTGFTRSGQRARSGQRDRL